MKRYITILSFLSITLVIFFQFINLNFANATESSKSVNANRTKNSFSECYEKEIIKVYDTFDDIKNAGETIDYGEYSGHTYFHGLLEFHSAFRLEGTDNFKVIYRGTLNRFENNISECYEKEIIKVYDTFDDMKSAGKAIDYGEYSGHTYFYGLLDFHSVFRIEDTDSFKAIYKGTLNNSVE